MKKLFILLASFVFVSSAYAQEPAAENQAPAEAAADADAARVDNTKANDPVDRMVAHLMNLNDIISKNLDHGDALLTEFKAYLDKNDKAMRMSAKAFKEKLEKQKASEAEAYREVAQRKLEPVLKNLTSLLLQLSEFNPEVSKKLDSMLKVDARYTYNP